MVDGYGSGRKDDFRSTGGEPPGGADGPQPTARRGARRRFPALLQSVCALPDVGGSCRKLPWRAADLSLFAVSLHLIATGYLTSTRSLPFGRRPVKADAYYV